MAPARDHINRGVYVSDTEADARAMLPHAVWHTRTALGLASNALPVNAGRAITDLTAHAAEQDDPAFLYIKVSFTRKSPDMLYHCYIRPDKIGTARVRHDVMASAAKQSPQVPAEIASSRCSSQ